MELTLIVIRTGDPKRLADFYSLFNKISVIINMTIHHFIIVLILGAVLFEIYPLSQGQSNADTSLCVGFSIGEFETVIAG